MEKIVWREQMSVDGGLIDEDHMMLIDLINEFRALSGNFSDCRKGNNGPVEFNKCLQSFKPVCGSALNCHAEACQILQALSFYTLSHFKREEELQRQVKYPVHADAHGALAGRLEEMIEELQAANKGDEFSDCVRKLGQMLANWIIDHILLEDLKMKPLVPNMKKNDMPALNSETPRFSYYQ